MPQAAPLLGQEVPASLQPGAMGSEPHIGSALQGTALPAMAIDPDQRVTSAEFEDDPRAATAKLLRLVGRDITDPKIWLQMLAGYLGPKVIQGLLPSQAIGHAPSGGAPTVEGSAPSPAPTGPSPIGAAVRAAVPRMINAAVGYRGKEAYGAVQEGISAARAARAPSPVSPVSPVASASPAVTAATAAPESAPVSPAPPPPPAAPAAAPSASPRTATMGSEADLMQVTGEFHRLVARGMSKEEALALIDKQLQLQQRLGGPSLEAVRRAVQFRNEKNRWPE